MYDIYFEKKLNNKDDLYFLKRYKNYNDCENKTLKFSYENKNSSNLKKLRKELNLDNIPKGKNELDSLINIRKWVSQTLSSGDKLELKDGKNIKKWDTMTIINLVKEQSLSCDCGTYAVVLTEILLALDYKARWVQCLPMDLRFSDSHCITHVYSSMHKKWIILDAALNLCYFNSKGIPLSLSEFRDCMIKEERIIIPSTNLSKLQKQWIIDYWRKNLFRFHSYARSEYGFSSKGKNKVHYYLNPLRFEIKDKIISSNGFVERHINTSNSVLFWEE